MKENKLLVKLRNREKMSVREKISLVFGLSLPTMLAQLSSIMMEYIDAAMVGRLGANDSAAIGLVATSTWLFYGMSSALSVGFNVLVAQKIGAGKEKEARNVVKIGLITTLLISLIIGAVGFLISDYLPVWLGGDASITGGAAIYFKIFSLSVPAIALGSVAGGMISCSGNTKIPSALNIAMCFMDIIFNAVFIFESGSINIVGHKIAYFGLGYGVKGAALGTALAYIINMVIMVFVLLTGIPMLKLRKNEPVFDIKTNLKNAAIISIPVAIEQIVTCGAQITSTKIVAPLGNVAIAANSFAITAESLCYMPGYGISSAATTLVGQSVGAKREDAKSFGVVTTILGMLVMGALAVLMYLFAPAVLGFLTNDAQIRELGANVLRIEAFAEPLYAASIVITGVLRGAGDTVVPSSISFMSMWLIRIPMAYLLAQTMGLRGVWFAMCTELCVKGLVFILILAKKNLNKG